MLDGTSFLLGLVAALVLALFWPRLAACARGEIPREDFTHAAAQDDWGAPGGKLYAPPEGFCGAPGSSPDGENYPGAIELDSPARIAGGESCPTVGPNPFQLDLRSACPGSRGRARAAQNVGSVEAPLTYDEANALQVRSRNDPERVWAGLYHKKKGQIREMLEEELDEEEQRMWWGRHEV